MKNKDNKQNSKILINGSYSILLTVLLLAGLIIVNLIVNHLPVKVTQFDFSNEKLYTLTDITTGILKNLDQDVELYYICEGGKEDDTIQMDLRCLLFGRNNLWCVAWHDKRAL